MNASNKEYLERTSIYMLIREVFLKDNRSGIVGATFVLMVVIFMIMPAPVWLLDVMIAINIAASCFLLILVMQIKHSVDMSTFPVVLLIATLFRVSINVSSTRQILLEGNAGDIIEAFGEVVIGGSIVVGLVIFFILTTVLFLVITKGSERVAEVGARFTLDAMPGKQLAIDIDARNGNISAEEAQLRRSLLAKESQFFGAMDGALKFVKGDAIAGILITLTNLIGGMVIGITQRQMSAGEAAQLYTVLSIGDALVAQIPALLTSISAGILITRISGVSEQDSGHVGRQITQQVTDYPKAWVTASISIAAFGLLPGMPWYVFFVLSAGSLLCGISLLRKEAKEANQPPSQPKYTDFDEIREFRPVFPFLLRFKSTQEDLETRVDLIRIARRTRNNLVLIYGLVSPPIETRSGVDLIDSEADFCHNEVQVLKIDIPRGYRVASCRVADIEAMDVQPIQSRPHPWHQEKFLFWLPKDLQLTLDERGIYNISDSEYVEKQFESALFRLAPRHFGIEQTSRLMRWLSSEYPEVGKELERVIPIPRFADVLQRLLLEKVSIRNILRISEILIEWGQKERDPVVLVECVRNGISREIANANGPNLVLSSLLIEGSTEERLRSSIRQTAFGDFLDLEVEYTDRLKDSLHDALMNTSEGELKVVLTAPDIRLHVRNMIADKFDEIAVMSLPEVPPDFKVHVLGVISGESSSLPI